MQKKENKAITSTKQRKKGEKQTNKRERLVRIWMKIKTKYRQPNKTALEDNYSKLKVRKKWRKYTKTLEDEEKAETQAKRRNKKRK